MSEEINLENLEKSLKTLVDGFAKFEKELDFELKLLLEDGCIQRFEYVWEMAWKTMKKFLKKEYGKSDAELKMENIFRLMAGYGFTKNWENWKNYCDKRNDSSHEYSLEKSREIIKIIPSFIDDATTLLENLKVELGSKK